MVGSGRYRQRHHSRGWALTARGLAAARRTVAGSGRIPAGPLQRARLARVV